TGQPQHTHVEAHQHPTEFRSHLFLTPLRICSGRLAFQTLEARRFTNTKGVNSERRGHPGSMRPSHATASVQLCLIPYDTQLPTSIFQASDGRDKTTYTNCYVSRRSRVIPP